MCQPEFVLISHLPSTSNNLSGMSPPATRFVLSVGNASLLGEASINELWNKHARISEVEIVFVSIAYFQPVPHYKQRTLKEQPYRHPSTSCNVPQGGCWGTDRRHILHSNRDNRVFQNVPSMPSPFVVRPTRGQSAAESQSVGEKLPSVPNDLCAAMDCVL